MKPKLAKAAWNDGLLGMSWIGFLVATIFLALIVFGILPSEEAATWVFLGILGLTAILFLWRLLWIQRLFRVGTVVEGIVDRVSIHRDRGIVTFFFVIGETFVKTSQPILMNKTTKTLAPGLKVQILYDAKKPKRALIVELYRS